MQITEEFQDRIVRCALYITRKSKYDTKLNIIRNDAVEFVRNRLKDDSYQEGLRTLIGIISALALDGGWHEEFIANTHAYTSYFGAMLLALDEDVTKTHDIKSDSIYASEYIQNAIKRVFPTNR